jgi:hypothetical protein
MRRSARRVVFSALVLVTLGALSGASALGSGSTAYRDAVLADAPISYWRLGESSGTTASDEMQANPGSYASGPSLGQPGAIWNADDRAVSFDGVDDYVIVPHSTSLSPMTAVSIEAWVKRSKSGVWQPLLGKAPNGQSKLEHYSLWFNTSNRAAAYFGNGVSFVTVQSAQTIDTNWHHVVATYDNATARLYVDGALSASTTSTIQLTANTNPLYLARTASGGFALGGLLDDVAVYRTALPLARVQAHFNAARVDTLAPEVTITQPSNESLTAEANPLVAGTAGTLGGDSATVTVKIFTGSTPTGSPVRTMSGSHTGSYGLRPSPPLTDGLYTARTEQTDAAGNTGFSGANRFTVDTVAPSVTIMTNPASLTNSTSATFGFTANEQVTGFECSLDGASFVSCSSPRSYSGLIEGAHTFQVRAIDLAQNTGAPASFTWMIDRTAPTTLILSGPSDPTSETSASFEFNSNESGSTFECALDGAPFTSCSSPATYSSLGDGAHAFQVRATDAAGNVGAPATFNWSVNVSGPSSAITLAPPNPSGSTSAVFAFVSGEPGSTFECELDGGGYAACLSPQSYTGLSEGSHTFRVRALDGQGTPGAPASYTWTIDSTAPTVTINSHPPALSNSANASFGFSANEPVSGFLCQLDSNPPAACTSPTNYTGLSDGPHTFQVQATDAAGNTSTPASYSWTINATAASVTITSAPPDPSDSTSATFAFVAGEPGSTFECELDGDGSGYEDCVSPHTYTGLSEGSHTFRVRALDGQGTPGTPASYTWTIDTTAPTVTITSHPPALSTSANASFGFSANEPGSSFLCRLDSGTAASCTSPTTYTGLSDGSHTFEVQATDPAGNTGATASYTWTIDSTGPSVTISQKPVDPTSATNATFMFTANEAVTGFQCKLDGGSFVACASPRAYSGLTEGAHSFEVRATDTAGNTGAATTYGWTVDTTAPTATIGTRPSDPSPSSTATFTFTANEAGSTFRCDIDDTGAADCTSPKTYNGLSDIRHTVEVQAVDTAGNIGPAAVYSWTVDTTPPAITLTTPANGSSTATQKPTFAGTASTASDASATVTVKIYAGTTATGSPVQTLTTTRGGGGAYSVKASTALLPAVYTARSEQADSVGNIGLSSANTFTVTDPIVLAAGDIAGCEEGSGEERTAAILDANPDATVLPLGDTAYANGTPQEFANCYDPSWGRAKARSLPTVGDHEYGTANASGYFNYFNAQLAPFGPAATDSTKGYYSYDLGTWHIVQLNSNCNMVGGCGAGSPVEQWLRADLAAHPNVCTLAYWHHPRFSSGSVHGSDIRITAFWQALYDYGVEVVLNGNEHVYERFAPQTPDGQPDAFGVRQFTVGTGGYFHYSFGTILPTSEARSTGTYGVLKLALRSGSYDWEFLPEAGRTYNDSGTGTCHGPVPPPPPPPPPPATAPTVRSAASNAVPRATSITIAKPTGTVAGDLLVALAGHQVGQFRNLTPPAGWTAIPDTDVADGNNVRLHGWYRSAGSSEPSSYTFNLTGGSGQDISGGILAITGANPSGPIAASGGQASPNSSKSVLAPSITTTISDTLLVYTGGCSNTVSFTPPAGMTEHWDIGTTSSTGKVTTEGAAQYFAGPGATGTRTATVSSSCRSVGVLAAIAPAP